MARFVQAVGGLGVSVPRFGFFAVSCTALTDAPFALYQQVSPVFFPPGFGEHIQVGNRDVWTDSPWGDMWRHDFWGQKMAVAGSHKSFRPLTTFTFRYLSSMFFLHLLGL